MQTVSLSGCRLAPIGYFSGLSYYTELLKTNDNNLSSRNAGLSRVIIRGYDEISGAFK